MTPVSTGLIKLTPTQPVGGEIVRQGSNNRPPASEADVLRQYYRAPVDDGDDDDYDVGVVVVVLLLLMMMMMLMTWIKIMIRQRSRKPDKILTGLVGTAQGCKKGPEEAGQLEQNDKQVSYSEEKAIIKSLLRRKWKQQHPDFNKTDSYHHLSRPDQVIVLRLRTGHNRMNSHMYKKFKIGESEMCPCAEGEMNTEHLLQHCTLHSTARKEIWPDETSLREKLQGDLGALQRTASFVRTTGISI
ncbi:hypothetical protein EGW08_011315 [Elysia chlorotica]|uniref:Reverse transcriptase zinc-binding domain-containing protein n=1 Tax=Elysia chlorotica TaxID=188477 RepID=A0A3S1A2F2_ELYCH|nr:hypothetical protein EGW08_011315 [Elysia chlorotica]